MLIKEEGTCQIICDGCGERTSIFDELDYPILLVEAAEMGFVARKVTHRVWENLCASCEADALDENWTKD
jgi:hypothetical protein